MIGLIGSIIFFLWGDNWPEHVSAPKRILAKKGEQSFPKAVQHLINFFFGFELNPRFGDLDIKMSLYLIGAVMIELVIISTAFKQYQIQGIVTPAMWIYLFEMTWFLVDYVYNEEVHLFTYDIVDENVGFKLIWGCSTVFSFFYPIGIFPLVSMTPQDTSTWQLVLSIITFFVGSILTRGANLQKYYFKRNPNTVFLGIKPVVIGNEKRKILASGFWGLARHINYLGEILQGVGLALTVGSMSILPWLYPLFYVMILLPRERDDDLRCSHKYGDLWKEYVKKVPYRILPGIY